MAHPAIVAQLYCCLQCPPHASKCIAQVTCYCFCLRLLHTCQRVGHRLQETVQVWPQIINGRAQSRLSQLADGLYTHCMHRGLAALHGCTRPASRPLCKGLGRAVSSTSQPSQPRVHATAPVSQPLVVACASQSGDGEDLLRHLLANV